VPDDGHRTGPTRPPPEIFPDEVAFFCFSPPLLPSPLPGSAKHFWIRTSYKKGYQVGLQVRGGGSPMVWPIEPALRSMFDSGVQDGQAARAPQVDDPELLLDWNRIKGTPAWDWSKGPAWVS